MRRVLYLLLASLLPVLSSAQTAFTYFSWDALRIDSLLPTYTEVVPLESDCRLFDYDVRVSYPEWAPLTPAETQVAERFAASLADTLTIHTFVGVSRGQGLLDISFVPIVRRDGRYHKLLSGKVDILPKAKPREVSRLRSRASRSPALAGALRGGDARWASHSVLAEGKWAKISVPADGIYHLTDALLRSMGFDPGQVRVYGYGGHRQDEQLDADADWDDLEPVSLMPVTDGYLFHANGLLHWKQDRHILNHYARTACYFVTQASEAVPDFPVTSSPQSSFLVNTFPAYAVLDPQEYAWFQGGRMLFENYDYATGNSRTYTLHLPTHAASVRSRLTVNFSAANDESTLVTPTFNGTPLSPFTVGSLANEYSYATVEGHSYTVDAPLEQNTIRVSTTSERHARLNYFELSYTGLMKLDAQVPYFEFEYQPRHTSETFRVEYASGQRPQLWRLAEPGLPATQVEGTTEELTDSSGVHHLLLATVDNHGTAHRYAVLDASAAFPQPAFAGTVANQDLHATEALDLVIITPASGIFDVQAERLAEAHRAVDGLRVGVFRADQIYNEFSSGTPDATAYRRFLKMLYDRADDKQSDAPRYLLLFGDGAWDNRMLTSAWKTSNPDDFLLCYESENSTSDTDCYVMEEYFGLLDDGEGKVLTREKTDLGVGRFPVRTVSEARAMVDKVEIYLRSTLAGAWKNVVCFMGDDGDHNDHLKKADQVANDVILEHPDLEVRKVMWDAYQRESSGSGNRYPQVKQVIEQQMEEGALMMNYTGHAATYCLSHEQVLRVEDFASFASPRLPLWVTAACDVLPFDTQKENIGETAMLNPAGAAVAFYGTTRTVYANANLPVNRAFTHAVFSADDLGRPNRLGDAVRYSKVHTLETYAGFEINKLHFALLGDPALRIGGSGHKVVLDSINGTAVSALPADFTLHAGGRARLSGHVEDADGQPLTDFSGTLSLRLYDSSRQVTCRGNASTGNDTLFVFSTYDRILYNTQDSIVGGRFSLTSPIPLDIAYSDAPGRLLFYAVSNDRTLEANGYSEDFLLGGTEADLADVSGPRIAAYLGNEDFEEGAAVGTSPFFFANLEDENGINASGNGIGHDLELIVDGDPSRTYVLNDYYTSEFGDFTRGSVAFTVPPLSAGPHTLLFRAWDTLNNPSSATLTFQVDPSKQVGVIDLTATLSPATTQTTFVLTYDRPGTPCQFTLEVFDFAGRQLWTHSATSSSSTGIYTVPWNLTTGGGFPLGSGVYLYRARVHCDDSETVTKARKLIVKRLKP